MAKLLVVIGILMMFGLAWMQYDMGDTSKAFAFGGFGFGIIIFSFLYNRVIKPAHDYASRDQMIEWIIQNKDELTKGNVRHGLQIINTSTLLTRYCIVFSYVFFTRKTYTNYIIKGSNKSFVIGVITTLSNLLTGWWGIPWGPIYTIQSIYINLFGRESISVGELIEHISNVEESE